MSVVTEPEHEIEIVRAALEATGWGPAERVAPLHPPRRLLRDRACFRVDLRSGATVKVRRFEDGDAAHRQQALRAGLPEAFAPVLARSGNVLIEAWIEGRPVLASLADPEVLIRAGALLAALHARPEAGGTRLPFDDSVGALHRFTQSGLAAITAAGAIDTDEAGLLEAIVADAAPEEAPHHLIHTDLCAENMVVDPAGRLFVIDNEDLRFGPAGMDLARAWYRWGWYRSDPAMPGWDLFRDAYRDAGGPPSAFLHEPFWRVAAAVVGAVLRLRGGDGEALREPLDCLRAIIRSNRSVGTPSE